MLSIKKLMSVFMLFGLSLFFSGAVFAAGSLNLDLIEQTPTIATPGSFVYVSVKVSNLGSDSVVGSKLSFVETKNFKIAEGEEIIKNLGVISSQNSVIKRFKIQVGNGAPLGYNSLKFNFDGSSTNVESTVNILVSGSNVGLITKSFEASTVAPGAESVLNIEFENLNSNTLKDVIVSLDLSSVEDGAFSLATGSNERVISKITSGSVAKISYSLVASPGAESKPYLIPATVTYTDDLGTSYSKDILGSVKVFSEPVLSLSLDSQEFFSTGKGVFTFAIANPGTSSIKGTMVEIVDGEDYNVLSGLIQYVGDLNPDDFQTIQSDIFVESESLKSIKLKITYLDSYNNANEKFFDIPVSIYSDENIGAYGLAANAGNSSSNTTMYIIFIVLLVGAFYFGKKKGSKK
jgi:hypothetical protein